MSQKNKLIVLTGPTAVGKTALSISLAKRIGGEIISADSMQVYKYMDIGSAKITKTEMEGIPHHLIDVLHPDEEFHVFRFQELAKEAMKGIYERGHLPILVGGTGFYIQALVYDIAFGEEKDHSAIRERWEKTAREKGNGFLHEYLEKVDPDSAKAIHPNNQKRIIRALEFYELNGTPISQHNQLERQKESPYDFYYFVLNDDRQLIYQRIDQRVDEMLAKGLVEEVRTLKEMGFRKDMVSMQGLGYKEILSYLDGECTLDEAVYLIKRGTRHFAKRQLTWFKRERDVIWIEKKTFSYDNNKILNYMIEKIDKL
ncbi:MAG: tRNA (adenosine(37)-N6)-dimethylallyltransferase MiaA [Lachnospiraceae bacterium]|nr:tRNA (adenosine(37)-N6)-dimethylallyltransferase MiaA [Lachnospiraceae bacterium]